MSRFRKLLRPFSWLLATVWLVLASVWLAPFGTRRLVEPREIQSYSSFQAARSEAEREFKPPFSQRLKVIRLGEESLTPLVVVPYRFILVAAPSQKELKVEPRPALLRVRYERLVGSFVMVAMIVLLGINWNGTSAPSIQRPIAGTLKELLNHEAAHCEEQCRYTSKRAKLMLWLGALVAAGGIGAIFFLFPWGVEGRSEGEKFLLIRSFALVFYIEALAFLLLRQYRLAQEDYAYFNGIRTRCVHFLSVLLAVETQSADVKAWFTATLPSEDPHYGRSKKPDGGKEKSEGAQLADSGGDSNPIQVALLTTLKDLLEPKKAG